MVFTAMARIAYGVKRIRIHLRIRVWIQPLWVDLYLNTGFFGISVSQKGRDTASCITSVSVSGYSGKYLWDLLKDIAPKILHQAKIRPCCPPNRPMWPKQALWGIFGGPAALGWPPKHMFCLYLCGSV